MFRDDVIIPLVLVLAKMSWYVQTFKDKDGDKDKNKNIKLMALHIDDDKLLEKYETIWTETDDLQNIELNALPVHDVRYIKNKIRTYGDKVYKTCHCLNVPKDGVKYDSFTIFSVDHSPAYEKKKITCKSIYSIVLIKL